VISSTLHLDGYFYSLLSLLLSSFFWSLLKEKYGLTQLAVICNSIHSSSFYISVSFDIFASSLPDIFSPIVLVPMIALYLSLLYAWLSPPLNA
jgi:hypothetical protein